MEIEDWDDSDLPPQWIPLIAEDNSNRVYYYNEKSRASRWERPQKGIPEPKIIRASHILIKHKDVRNPVSKGANPGPITRDIDEASLEAYKLLDQILSSPTPSLTFNQIALERSDCNSYIRSGDLGRNAKNKWHKQFSDAAFELDVNEISGIVSSPSGLHIILRTE